MMFLGVQYKICCEFAWRFRKMSYLCSVLHLI